MDLADDPLTSINIQHVKKIDNSALLKLAKEQKMNTDVRKSIFVIIITSEVTLNSMTFCKKVFSELKYTNLWFVGLC